MDSLRDHESGIELSSSEDDLRNCRNRRNAVHYASIGEFLSSLNISDTALASLQGLKTLSLEHYKSCMQNPEMPPGDMDRMKSDLMPSQDKESSIVMDRLMQRKLKSKVKGKGKGKTTEQLDKKHELLKKGRKMMMANKKND